MTQYVVAVVLAATLLFPPPSQAADDIIVEGELPQVARIVFSGSQPPQIAFPPRCATLPSSTIRRDGLWRGNSR
jgi:hypothetical protein